MDSARSTDRGNNKQISVFHNVPLHQTAALLVGERTITGSQKRRFEPVAGLKYRQMGECPKRAVLQVFDREPYNITRTGSGGAKPDAIVFECRMAEELRTLNLRRSQRAGLGSSFCL